MKISKEYLLTQSKTFCVLPWIHLYVNPQGVSSPCCISGYAASNAGVGNTKLNTIQEVVNSPEMVRLRRNMLNGIQDPSCSSCHSYEAQGITSPRAGINAELGNSFSEDMVMLDGSMPDFKMKYYDVRFSNICNFKCRSCGAKCSSLWEQEDKKHNIDTRIIQRDNRKDFLPEVIAHIQHMDMAYFAGGEPLITEEHYVLLEEMIKQKRTDIRLKYNTNLSNLRFKDKDLLGLWKHFTHDIQVYASVDHYGDRAEYIRHGTNWGQVESNFLMVKKTPGVVLQMNTVLSLYNCSTMFEFYEYMYEKKLYDIRDRSNSLYHMTTPTYLNANILPPEYKERARTNLTKLGEYLTSLNAHCTVYHHGRLEDKLKQFSDTKTWLTQESTWEQNKEDFRRETNRLDNIRGESFVNTFPELAGLMED
jgi:MoaA/NifB/PqqE/SkfB family radical SAM enzyme